MPFRFNPLTGELDLVNSSYDPSTDTLHVLRAGDTMTGPLVMPSGSVSAPALTHAADLDTGLYFPSNDTVAIATGGTRYLNVSNTGNVGINTALTNERLGVVGNFEVKDADTSTKSYRFRSTGGALDFEASGAQMVFSNWSGANYTGTQRFYMVMENGAQVLQLVKDIQFRNGSNGTQRHRINGDTGGNVEFNSNQESTDVQIKSSVNANTLFAKGSTGHVGINNNAPDADFHVTGSDLTAGTYFDVGGTGSSRMVFEIFVNDSAENMTFECVKKGSGLRDFFLKANNVYFDLKGSFSNYAGIIRGSDNFWGINTTSPTTQLDVNGESIRVRTAKTPASASATGDAGTIAWDSNYMYVCVAANTWKRTALSTW